MNEENKYNGWANYETWLFALNVDNEQGTQEIVKELAQQTDSATDFKESMEELFYNEELDLYKISDRWLERDWNDINFYEILQYFKGEE